MSGRNLAVAVAAVAVAVALASGCGAHDRALREGAGDEAPGGQAGYGIAVSFPAGWHGRVRRGAVHAATFPLPPEGRAFTRAAGGRVRSPDDVLVLLFENPPELTGEYEELSAAPQLRSEDFDASDGVTDDSARSGHGFARRLVEISGRSFVLFVESGSRPPPDPVLRDLNDVLASLRVEPGDFFPGSVEPARFAQRRGWHTGSSGPVDRRADGEFTTSWAATIPYADEWNALPPHGTLERLPRDGIVIWVGVSRSNRFPPQPEGDEGFPVRTPPFALAEFERNETWQGQVRELPEYRLHVTIGGQYELAVRVYFGRAPPTSSMLAEAQAMLDGLVLPDWGPWESG